MKFTKKDIEILKGIYNGADDVLKEELKQLENATETTKYSYVVFDKVGFKGDSTTKEITRKQAIHVLGREKWLSGIVRSAFHQTARRECEDNCSFVLFTTEV